MSIPSTTPELGAHPILAQRARWLLLLILIAYAALAARLVRLQYMEHPLYEAQRRQQIQTETRLAPWRESILDAHGRILAVSVPSMSCALDPQRMREAARSVAETVQALETVIALTPRDIERIHQAADRPDTRFVWIQRHLPPAAYQALRDTEIPGVFFPKEYRRTHPQQQLGSHVVGFTDIDGTGLEGIELVCNALLRGSLSRLAAERDARGRLLISTASAGTDNASGTAVQLTLDATIQMITEEELARVVDAYKGPQTTGCALVMDPYTGDVLALASIPTFNPEARDEAPVSHRLNLPIASVIEPGSTYKTFTMAAALEEKTVSLQDRFHCENGAWRMANGRILHDAHGYGWLTTAEVLIKSSNVGIAKIAATVGTAKLHRYLRLFGFGALTEIGLPGEIDGCLHPLARWTSYSMGSVPMGQEVSVTPIQLATAYCAIANGGILMKPRLVKALGADTEQSATPIPPATRRQAIRPETAAILRDLLGRVVSAGTGRRAELKEYSIGGKTGTSQLPVNAEEFRAGKRGYSETRYISSFVGMAPHDVPRIVVLVSVREPQGAHYGGVVAAPAVREIVRRTLLYLRVPPRES